MTAKKEGIRTGTRNQENHSNFNFRAFSRNRTAGRVLPHDTLDVVDRDRTLPLPSRRKSGDRKNAPRIPAARRR